MKFTSRLLSGLAVLALLAAPLAPADAPQAKVTYEDLSGRFALDIPDGWKLLQEQFNQLYIFGKSGSIVKLILMYSDGASDLAKIYSDAVDMATGAGLCAPTDGSVADMTLNGSSARWAEYPCDIAAGKKTAKIHVFLGAALSGEHKAGITFLVSLTPKDYEKLGEPLRSSWESLRLHGKPLTGIGEVGEVDAGSVRIEKKAVEASVFEHELISVSLPAGWASEPGKSSGVLATVKHERLGTLTIMGGPKSEFGKTRDQILGDLGVALLSSIPAMKSARAPWTVPTAGCGDAALAQYEGALVAAGVEIPHGALLAGMKDSRRGLGFMAIFKSDVKEEAVDEILRIIASAK